MLSFPSPACGRGCRAAEGGEAGEGISWTETEPSPGFTDWRPLSHPLPQAGEGRHRVRGHSSPKRRREQQAAILPQPVLAARQTEPRAFAEMALEDLAIISDLLDRLIGPVGGEAVLLSEIVADAKQAFDLRHLAFLHLVDVRLRDTELFGGDQREKSPAHDMRPLAVVLAHQRADRLLRDDLGADHMRIAVLQ